ncbi:helix-turn-helix transcriptional regulator [Sphingopyxis sp. NJF-3]
MELKTYLESHNIRQADFAAQVSTTPATISRIVSGSLRPALDLAHRIERATDGHVPTETWLSEQGAAL